MVLFKFYLQDSVDGTAVGLHHDFSVASSANSGFQHLHHPNAHPVNYRRPVAARGSHSSDTSSAYSGSDTMQVRKKFSNSSCIIFGVINSFMQITLKYVCIYCYQD